MVSEARVGRDKDLEAFALSRIEQLTILEHGPAAFISGRDFVLRQCFTQRDWCALVEKYAHSGRRQRAAGSMLQHGANLVERDAWKQLDKSSHLYAILEILE